MSDGVLKDVFGECGRKWKLRGLGNGSNECQVTSN